MPKSIKPIFELVVVAGKVVARVELKQEHRSPRP